MATPLGTSPPQNSEQAQNHQRGHWQIEFGILPIPYFGLVYVPGPGAIRRFATRERRWSKFVASDLLNGTLVVASIAIANLLAS